ncbi:MAG: metal-dependent transcriptional regulator [Acidimicrobiaceae bacterium]|nr:metal-dependent transcriptional regulator [Acidimicrobiaceae bacterium]
MKPTDGLSSKLAQGVEREQGIEPVRDAKPAGNKVHSRKPPDDGTTNHASNTLNQNSSTTTHDANSPNFEEYGETFEEYCETIYGLNEDNLQVIQARIAERLEVSPPAVSETIKRMKKAGLVESDSDTITLTEAGNFLGAQVVRRHRIAERFLTDILNLPWAQAHTEASKWEHVISTEVEQSMMKVLNQPTTCPHGNPIPGSEYEPPNLVALKTLGVGDRFTIRRILEELEFKAGMLNFLEQSRIVPGVEGTITACSPNGTSTLEIQGTSVGLDNYITARVLVTNSSTD